VGHIDAISAREQAIAKEQMKEMMLWVKISSF